MKKTVAIIACAFISQYGSAQWAGSSSDAGSSRQAPLKEQRTPGRGKFTMGFPIYATYVSSLLDLYNYPLYEFPINGVTVEEGFKMGLTMGGSAPVAANPNLELGVEFGFSYGYQTLKYQTYSTWSPTFIEQENQIDCYHIGAGLTVQYNFPMTNSSNFYVKAILGPGINNITDEDYDSYLESDYVGTFYGGGVLGIEGSGFFAEAGYTSVGMFRVGLKL
jgi:hypothetical protein